MEEYKQILINKIESLKNVKTPFARSRINILLKLLAEIESSE